MEHTATVYKKLVGDMRYLADCTLPDLASVVGRLGDAEARSKILHNAGQITILGSDA